MPSPKHYGHTMAKPKRYGHTMVTSKHYGHTMGTPKRNGHTMANRKYYYGNDYPDNMAMTIPNEHTIIAKPKRYGTQWLPLRITIAPNGYP